MIGGIHHISMKCGTAEEFEKAKDFYLNILGLKIKREWPEGIMIDAGNCLIEIFNNGSGEKTKGAIRHLAFSVDNVDNSVEKVRTAGYEVFLGPKDIVINSDPELPARIAFCIGPLGEEIEFFCEKNENNKSPEESENVSRETFLNTRYCGVKSTNIPICKTISCGKNM